MTPCRCGHDGTGPHRCHAGRPDPHGTGEDGSRWCTQDGKPRFVASVRASLSGMQDKASVAEHWYCDEHWAMLTGRR